MELKPLQDKPENKVPFFFNSIDKLVITDVSKVFMTILDGDCIVVRFEVHDDYKIIAYKHCSQAEKDYEELLRIIKFLNIKEFTIMKESDEELSNGT